MGEVKQIRRDDPWAPHPLGCEVVKELQGDAGQRYRIWRMESDCPLEHPGNEEASKGDPLP